MRHKELPPRIYIGIGRFRRIPIYPLPPEQVTYNGIGEYHAWAMGTGQDCEACPFNRDIPFSFGDPIDCGFSCPESLRPYSIRSVIIQMSMLDDFPCKYFIQSYRTDHRGNEIWGDGCTERCHGWKPNLHPCHLVDGWIHGESTCKGWEFICKILESQYERLFLHHWLRLNRGMETPMPIPQVYVDPPQLRRADFVLYIPNQKDNWGWYIIEIDSPEFHSNSEQEKERDLFLNKQGYEVIHLSTEERMLDTVRDVYSQLIL